MVTVKYHLEALRFEVELLKTRLEEHDTGHIHTAIVVLEDRIKEIEGNLIKATTRDYNV
jgi:hypothetical protein